MTINIKYEVMIILSKHYNENELKTWAFSYAKILQKLKASEISVISRGKRDLAYMIKDQTQGNFIQINFLSIPKYIKKFLNGLKNDKNVLRFLILTK